MGNETIGGRAIPGSGEETTCRVGILSIKELGIARPRGHGSSVLANIEDLTLAPTPREEGL